MTQNSFITTTKQCVSAHISKETKKQRKRGNDLGVHKSAQCSVNSGSKYGKNHRRILLFSWIPLLFLKTLDFLFQEGQRTKDEINNRQKKAVKMRRKGEQDGENVSVFLIDGMLHRKKIFSFFRKG